METLELGSTVEIIFPHLDGRNNHFSFLGFLMGKLIVDGTLTYFFNIHEEASSIVHIEAMALPLLESEIFGGYTPPCLKDITNNDYLEMPFFGAVVDSIFKDLRKASIRLLQRMCEFHGIDHSTIRGPKKFHLIEILQRGLTRSNKESGIFQGIKTVSCLSRDGSFSAPWFSVPINALRPECLIRAPLFNIINSKKTVFRNEDKIYKVYDTLMGFGYRVNNNSLASRLGLIIEESGSDIPAPTEGYKYKPSTYKLLWRKKMAEPIEDMELDTEEIDEEEEVEEEVEEEYMEEVEETETPDRTPERASDGPWEWCDREMYGAYTSSSTSTDSF